MERETSPFAAQSDTRRCPYCGRVVPADVITCGYCGGSPDGNARPLKASGRTRFSRAVFMPRFFLDMIVSFGYYDLWWIHKTCKLLKGEKRLAGDPLGFAFFCFVPGLNYVYIYRLFKAVKEFGRDESVPRMISPLLRSLTYATMYNLFYFFIFKSNLAGNLPITFFFLSVLLIFLKSWFLLSPQKILNEIWEKREPDLPLKKDQYGSEDFWPYAIGTLIWISFILLVSFGL
jgi:hypothetical protein